jgi:triosephosphate isomerase
MRKPIIAGNWKMHCTRPEATALVKGLQELLTEETLAEVVLCPPFTALATVAELIEGTSIKLGAQNLFWKEHGAYTGQIAPRMLVDLGCSYVIIGHSETRGRFGVPEPDFDTEILAYFGDGDQVVNRKIKAALAAGLVPILCIGETLAERRDERTDEVVHGQVLAALEGLDATQAAGIVFAYEPVWAIGTGEVCAADEADRVCSVVRNAVGEAFGAEAAEAARVQYGGSVKPDNAELLLGQPNIDGALVGGASLKAGDFAKIVLAAS